MWKELFLVTVFVVAFSEGCLYKKAECPDYTVVESHPDYEIRSYPSITWATTIEQSRFRRIGQYKAFMRLFRYISGENDKAQKMNMTVPVRMQNTRTDDNGTIFEMSFMVPSEFATSTPVPKDEGVQISREVPTLYAVRSFGGYAWRQGLWESEAQKLADSVKDDETVVKTTYYQVGYDAPFELFDRRNEIWMTKTDSNEV